MKKNLYAWIVVALLWVTVVLNYVDRQALFSVFPLIRGDLGLSNLQLGLLSSVFLWAYGLVSPFLGFLGDRLGRKKVIVPSLMLWSLATWLTGLARNFHELFLARALMGISEACYLPAALAMITDYHSERSRSLATAIHQTGIYAGLVLGGVGGAWLGQEYGWRVAFTALGAIGVLYMGVLYFSLKESMPPSQRLGEPKPRLMSSARELLSKRDFLIMMAAFSAVSMANWILYTWLPIYFYDRFQMSLRTAGFSATFYLQVAGVGGTIVGGRLADAWSRSSGRGRLLTQIVGLAAAGPCLILVGYTDHPSVLIGGLVGFGLCKGFYECNVMPVLCNIARPELRSTGFGILNFAASSTAGLTAAAAGGLRSVIGLGGVMQVSGIVLFLAAMLLGRVRLTPAPSEFQSTAPPSD